MSDDAELEDFKRDIDLRQYAASIGYEMDKRDSWRGSTVMRRGADKIVVKRNSNSHFVYFSVRDDADDGSIIDFIQRRRPGNIGHVRLALRQWIGRPAAPLPLLPKLEPASKDRLRVETEFRRMEDAPRHPYLEAERGIPGTLLSSPRYAGRVRIDGRGNAVFPHFDQEGLCGYEIKNRGFTSFASGGEKGLWSSRTQPDDAGLVIAESAIDALSYAALFPDTSGRTRYVSTGGKLNPKQPGLLQAAFGKLETGSIIVAAFDADAGGRDLVELVCSLFESSATEMGRKDLTLRVHLPSVEGRDWNDELRQRNSPFPIARFENL